MIYLLDVNALIALGVMRHEFHGRAANWVKRLGESDRLATCPITELGFVRVLAQPVTYGLAIDEGKKFMARLKVNLVRPFEFFPDTHGADRLPDWVRSARQTTDGHLLALAEANGAALATFDRGIPGASLIPEL